METKIQTKTKWALDPAHSEITFRVKHLMIANVNGEFREFTAEVETPGDDFSQASIRASIRTASVFTNANDRDAHLRSADFFDSENHPEMKFTATSFAGSGTDYKMKGLLEIRGVSKEVTFDVEFGGINKDPWGNEKAGFSLSTKIHRKDWGLNWNAALETGGVLVSDEVKIHAEIQLTKQA